MSQTGSPIWSRWLAAASGTGGADYASGDLYEAEELFRSGHPIQKNRLVLVHRPEGTVYEPVRTESGQYLGRPVYHSGQVILLLVDFPKGEIRILIFRETDGTTEPLAVLPLSAVEDCYNLMLEASPLMLTRSAHDKPISDYLAGTPGLCDRGP